MKRISLGMKNKKKDATLTSPLNISEPVDVRPKTPKNKEKIPKIASPTELSRNDDCTSPTLSTEHVESTVSSPTVSTHGTPTSSSPPTPSAHTTPTIPSNITSPESSPALSVFSSPDTSIPSSPTSSTPQNALFSMSIKSDPHEFWYEPKFMCDIVLYIDMMDDTGIPSGTQVTIHSHKQVLCAASLYFRTIFEKDKTIDSIRLPSTFIYSRVNMNPLVEIVVPETAIRILFDLMYRIQVLSTVLAADPDMNIHMALLVMCQQIHESTHVSDDIENDMVMRIGKHSMNTKEKAERLLHYLLVAQHLNLTRVAIAAGQHLCSNMDQPAVHQLVVSCPLLDLVQSCHLRSALIHTSASRVLTSELASLSNELTSIANELSSWRSQHLPLLDPKSVTTTCNVAAHDVVVLVNKIKTLMQVSDQIKDKMVK